MFKTKKLLSVLIALIMAVSCFSLSAINVFAANNAAPTATCAHTWGPATTVVTSSYATYYSKEYCRWDAEIRMTCLKCREPHVSHTYVYTLHEGTKLSVSCNGKIQTIKYSCKNCISYTEKQPCPAGPHTGLCPSLSF